MTSFWIEFQTEEEAKENERSPSVALLCAGLLRGGMVYELERVFRVCNGFLCSVPVTWWCSTAVAVVAQTSYFVSASYFDRKPMKWFKVYGYTRWLWKAQDYSSCIVLYPLQVGCHIMSRTKQQWVTVVNSWQSKSRYKCGSCSTCQESTNRCQTAQFLVACPSNIGDMCIHSKMTV